jgi:hypothetical protein
MKESKMARDIRVELRGYCILLFVGDYPIALTRDEADSVACQLSNMVLDYDITHATEDEED